MKLVRDKIIQIMQDKGLDPDFSIASKETYSLFLARKMIEELEEFMQDPCAEEAGDMLEVARALFASYGISMGEVTHAANIKKQQRGGFGLKIILHKKTK